MFGLSLEHWLIIGIILLVFGPKRLPTLARSIGKTIRNFRDGRDGVQEPEFRRLDKNEEIESKVADDEPK